MNERTSTGHHGDDAIIFDDDTLVLGRSSFFSWHEDGDSALIIPAEAEIIVPYRCEGGALRLDEDGVVSVWTRVVDV